LLAMAKPFVVSVSGKGGTGKTTVAALLLKAMVDSGVCGRKKVLMVDADPDTNLPDFLGVNVSRTVGSVANELKRRIEKGQIPAEVSKRDLLEAWVYSTLIEERDFDMLVMGRTEGEGCYCYVNSVLTGILDVIASNYDIVVMDMEAGLEHISRRTDRDVDVMLIVCDPSRASLMTAKRIRDVAGEVHVKIKEIYLVGNRIAGQVRESFIRAARDAGFKVIGVVPEDPNVYEYNIVGKSLLELPGDSPAVSAVREIAERLGLLA